MPRRNGYELARAIRDAEAASGRGPRPQSARGLIIEGEVIRELRTDEEGGASDDVGKGGPGRPNAS